VGGGGRVRKEGGGCGRREEDLRGEMRMWEGEGRSERRGKSAKEGGGYGTKEEDVRGGRKGKSEKEGESVEGGENVE